MRGLPARYSYENLTRLASNPRMAVGELNRLGNRLNRRVHAVWPDGGGVDVMAEDWDVLLILDGCRYDLYESVTTLEGDLQRRRSQGSDSLEFLRANFFGRTLHDTVYLTANPHAYRLDEDTFHRVVNLLKDDWDPELQTVRPEVVADEARRIATAYPDKRLIVHFMQPHFPFIGETGRQLDQGGIVMNVDGAEPGDLMIWAKLMYGLVDERRVRTAYRENLELVLDVVEDLLADLPGRAVITSDHGNLVGDRLWPIPTRGYGHPRGVQVSALRDVPWQIVPGDERPTIRADPPEAFDRPDEDVVTDRLRNLGYAE